MKKILYMVLAAVLFAACSSETDVLPAPEQVQTHDCLRTPAEAVEIAMQLNEARSQNSRSSVREVAEVAVIGSTMSRGEATDTLIYAVNYADNSGYTLISAAKSGEAIIGYVDNGRFNEEEVAANPSFNYYMDAAKAYVSSNIASPNGDSFILPIDPIT